MSDNVYKTSQGKEIDIGELILKNEEVRAVGNMKVNARGDSIDSNNKNVASRNKQVSKNYRKQIGKIVQDMPVMDSQRAAKIAAEKNVEPTPLVPTEIQGLDTNEITTNDAPVEAAPTAPESVKAEPVKAEPVKDEPVETVETAKPGGLAGAIAKAREVKQEPVKTLQEEARTVDGVKKI